MIRLGLLGQSIAHSRSPEIFSAFAKDRNIAIEYALLETPIEHISDRLAHCAENSFLGLNVTSPLKEVVLAHVQSDDIALACQGSNCLTLREGIWHATNTDVDGFKACLQRWDWPWERTYLLGTGPAARAGAWTLSEWGCYVVLISRDPEKVNLNWPVMGYGEPLQGPAVLINATSQPWQFKNLLESGFDFSPFRYLLDLHYQIPLEMLRAHFPEHQLEYGQYFLETQAEASRRCWGL